MTWRALSISPHLLAYPDSGVANAKRVASMVPAVAPKRPKLPVPSTPTKRRKSAAAAAAGGERLSLLLIASAYALSRNSAYVMLSVPPLSRIPAGVAVMSVAVHPAVQDRSAVSAAPHAGREVAFPLSR